MPDRRDPRRSCRTRSRRSIVVAAGDHGVAARGRVRVPAGGDGADGRELRRRRRRDQRARAPGRRAARRRRRRRRDAVEHELVRAVRLGPARRTSLDGPAMTRERGAARAATRARRSPPSSATVDVVALGEMGIGNTTSASALCAALLGVDPARVCGRGTGLDDAGVARKVDVVRRALDAERATRRSARRSPLGGFEIAFLAGRRRSAVRGERSSSCSTGSSRAPRRSPPRGSTRLRPRSLIASHRSPEPGHALVLDALGLEPLLDLGLRLGEGAGAALALPLLRRVARDPRRDGDLRRRRRHRCRPLSCAGSRPPSRS